MDPTRTTLAPPSARAVPRRAHTAKHTPVPTGACAHTQLLGRPPAGVGVRRWWGQPPRLSWFPQPAQHMALSVVCEWIGCVDRQVDACMDGAWGMDGCVVETRLGAWMMDRWWVDKWMVGGWMEGWVDEGRWIDGWMDGWMDGWVDGGWMGAERWIGRCVDGYLHG